MKALILFLLGLALTPLCFAQATYTYTYSAAALAQSGGLDGSPGVTSLSGTVTLSAPLAANQANQAVTPVAWSMGGLTYPSATTFPASSDPTTALYTSFTFSTVNGQITAWAVSAYSYLEANNAVICV